MSLDNINAKLSALQDSIKQSSRLIGRLATSQLDRPPREEAQERSSMSDKFTHEKGLTDLTDEIQENLNAHEEELDLIGQALDDEVMYGSRRRHIPQKGDFDLLRDTCSRLQEDLKLARTSFRKAQLRAKLNKNRARQREQLDYLRNLRTIVQTSLSSNEVSDPNFSKTANLSHSEMRSSLFANRRIGLRSSGGHTKEDIVLTQSTDLTLSLRRTHDLLASEVSRSRFAQETLNSSNAALEDLNQRYGSLDDMLTRSRGLLGTLLRSQKSDTWYLETAVWLLVGTIAWLVSRRWLYGPLWWFVYLPFNFAWSIFSTIAPGKGKSAGNTMIPGHITQPMFAGQRSVAVINSEEGISDEAYNQTPLHDVVDDIVTKIASASEAMHEYLTVTGESSQPRTTQNGSEATRQQEELNSERLPGSSAESDNEADKKKIDGSDSLVGGHTDAVRAGDGRILPPRDANQPINPKKRMFEDNPTIGEEERHAQARDGL